MKTVAALLLLPLLAVPAGAAQAQEQATRVSVSHGSDDSPGRIGRRWDPRDARSAITTRDGMVMMLLTRDAVALQLTDRGLRDVRREMHEEAREEGGFLAEVIAAAVRGSVGTMLKRSVEYPVSELRDVSYRGGRLVFTGVDGERVFEKVTVNDADVMESFSEAEARAFVREFRRVKDRSR